MRAWSCRDWEMPEMNGVQLCRAIREEDAPGYVYVILLTSRDAPQDRVEGLRAGADDFVAKPTIATSSSRASAAASASFPWKHAMWRSCDGQNWPKAAIRKPARTLNACEAIAVFWPSISRAWINIAASLPPNTPV